MKEMRNPLQPPESVSSSFVFSNLVFSNFVFSNFVLSNLVLHGSLSSKNVEKSGDRLLKTAGVNP